MKSPLVAGLSEREKVLLTLAGLGLLTALFLLFWYLPAKSYLAQRGRVLRAREEELRAVQSLARSTSALQARLARARREKLLLDSRFPYRLEPARLVEQLWASALDAGVALNEVTAAADQEGGGKPCAFSAYTLDVGCAGSYPELVAFVKKIKGLTPLFMIDGLEIKKQPDGALQARLTLKTFVDAGENPLPALEEEAVPLLAPGRQSPF